VREAAYEGLPFRRRRELHARAGEIVERRAGDDLDEWSDLLSLHFTIAGDDARSWRYSRLAGDRAKRAFAPVEAAAFYQRAVAAARHLACVTTVELGHLYETLGDCWRYAGTYPKAIEAYGQARRALASNPVRLADLHRKEGMVRERSGRYADALRWYTRGRRVLVGLGDDHESLQVRAQLTLFAGVARLRQGRYLESIPLLEAAADLAERLGDRETLAHAYDLLDWAHTDLGNDERHAFRELALPIYEELGNLQRQGVVASNLGIDAYFEGRWDDAMSWYERGRDASERAGDVVQMATAINNLGEVESDRGHLDEARRLFGSALRIWRAAPFPVGVALATSNLGRVEVRAGALTEAATILAEARAAFGAIGAESYVLETDVRELERLVAAGEPAAALELATDVERRSRRAGGLPLQMLANDRAAAYAHAQLGHVNEAVRLLEDVADRARGLAADYELALTLEALDRVLSAAGRAEAEAHRIAAAQLFERLGVTATPPVPLPVAVPTA
jgi:tetratricopeptide (TPR) repeat protein